MRSGCTGERLPGAKLPRCQPRSRLEVAREMSLIGKAAIESDRRRRGSEAQQPTRLTDTAIREKGVRRDVIGPSEDARG